jgi:drug/metabolite transporter (DMT)-like permease
MKKESPLAVITAFAIVYIVWGSTYFFIQRAVGHFPPGILGAIRFISAGLIMLIWRVLSGEKMFNFRQIKYAAFTGFLMLFVGTGAVILAEKTIPSSLAAVFVASGALWFVVFDKPKWRENFTNKKTILGLIIGFVGVLLLFSENAAKILSGGEAYGAAGFIILVIGTMAWAAGSLFSKAKSIGSSWANATWQMIAAGLSFFVVSLVNKEWQGFQFQSVPTEAWLSVLYLIFMGSLAGYGAYVWLLQVRSVTQVSTHVYVNPVVAVLLGVFLAGERLSLIQLTGLAIILSSVLLINTAHLRKKMQSKNNTPKPKKTVCTV